MTFMSDKATFSCRTFEEKDEAEVKKIVENAFPQFLGGQFWNWKYKGNPDFDPSLIMVAETDGKVVGCNHWLLRSFMLSSSLETRAILGGDLAVSPECRGKGVGSALLRSQRASRAMKNLHPSIAYTFAVPQLASQLHSPVAGYVPIRANTTGYFKILNWKMVAERAALLNERIASGKCEKKLDKFILKVLLRITNTPSLSLVLSENGVSVKENVVDEHPNVTITGSLSAFQDLRYSKNIKRTVIFDLLKSKLRIVGKPKSLMALQKNVWLLQEVLGKK
jgi:predicted N-acetyltransferase YhbS